MGQVSTVSKRAYDDSKNFLLPKFTYIALVLDPNDKTYKGINHFFRNFINSGTIKPSTRNYWIHQDISYGPKK